MNQLKPRHINVLGAGVLALMFVAPNAVAKDDEATQISTCGQKMGSVAIDDPPNEWWHSYNLDNPEALIKLLVQKSGCFDIVDRDRGLSMRSTERALADAGELQRNSNMGAGQVKVADYFIIPDIVSSDSDAGGSDLAALAAGKIGGKLGGIFGKVEKKELTAHTLLSVVNARTTQNMFVSEGKYKHEDVSIGGGGFFAVVGAIGGGYDDTEIGQVVSAAYVVAYNDLVQRISAMGPASDDQPNKSYRMSFDSYMYKGPSRNEQLRALRGGTDVFATGKRDGIFLEVEDSFGIVGWVSVEDLEQ